MNFLVDSQILYPNENGFLYEKKSFFYLLKILLTKYFINSIPIEKIIDLCSFGKVSRLHSLLKWYLLGKPYYNIFIIDEDKDRNKFYIVYFTLSFSLSNWYLLFINIEVYRVMYIGYIGNIFHKI